MGKRYQTENCLVSELRFLQELTQCRKPLREQIIPARVMIIQRETSVPSYEYVGPKHGTGSDRVSVVWYEDFSRRDERFFNRYNLFFWW